MTAQGQQRGPGEAVDQVAAELGQAAAEAQERPRAELGDPSTDPPMTVRIEPGQHWRDLAARRAVRTSDADAAPWFLVTGRRGGDWDRVAAQWLAHDEVRDWPVTHPIEYSAAFRHAVLADEQERAPLTGDDLAGPDARLFR